MSATRVASPRLGDLGKALRRFTLWPSESPVPTALPAVSEPAAPKVPDYIPVHEPETIEVER